MCGNQQGSPTSFTEFVIYEKRRALVECIITFTRNETPSASGDASSAAQASQPPICPSGVLCAHILVKVIECLVSEQNLFISFRNVFPKFGKHN